MVVLLKILLVVSSVILIASILLQSGKSAGLSGSIGGGAEQIFGKQKAKGYDSLFDKITKVAAVAFIVCALLITVFQ